MTLIEKIERLKVTIPQVESIGRQVRLELIRRAAIEKNILEWGRLLFPEKFPLEFCWELHKYFVDIRNEPLTNTESPRNHAKTTIKCFLIPIFQALVEPETYRHYLNVQATGTKAMMVNTSIRHELETNEDLIAIYGNQIGERWTDWQFVLRNGVVFTAVGAGQSIRGIHYHNVRPDYILVDDLYDEEDINNPDSTLKKNDWFWGSLYPARAKSRDCCIHVQGTAINDEDILEKLKSLKRWRSKSFKAIKDNGQILWPKLNTKESLAKDRADMGSVIFMREMMNERRDQATAIIKKSYLRYYNPMEVKFGKDSPLELLEVILGVDPSIGKDKSENDFTGIALTLKCKYEDADGHFYFIENVWNEKLSLYERVQFLKEIQRNRPKDRPITQVNIEGISGFQDFVQEVIRQTDLPVNPIEKVSDKITNLENKSHYFENGKVYINKSMPQELLDILIYQLTTNHPKHDDVRDGVFLTIDRQSVEVLVSTMTGD